MYIQPHSNIMDNKEQLVNAIRNWVRIDNEMRTLNKELTLRRKEKKNISENLIQVMRQHDIDEIDINDGQLVYNKKDTKKPITQKDLLPILAKYFDGDLDKANEIRSYIVENRQMVTKESISRKIKKKTALLDDDDEDDDSIQ